MPWDAKSQWHSGGGVQLAKIIGNFLKDLDWCVWYCPHDSDVRNQCLPFPPWPFSLADKVLYDDSNVQLHGWCQIGYRNGGGVNQREPKRPSHGTYSYIALGPVSGIVVWINL